MSAADRQDPLYQEAVGMGEQTATNEQPQPKKRKVTEEGEVSSAASSDLIKAIMEGAKLIADALDSNTRAVRCVDKTTERERCRRWAPKSSKSPARSALWTGR